MESSDVPLKIRMLFESTGRQEKDFRQSKWYGAIFKAWKNQGFETALLPFEIKNYITSNEPKLFAEVEENDTRLGKKIGAHLSQLSKAWGLLEARKIEGVRFQEYVLNGKYKKELIKLIEKTFM